MEPHTASVYSSGPVPRLRVTRRPSSTASSGLPPFHRSAEPKHSPSNTDSQTTSEDESATLDFARTTPRLLSASLPPPDSTAESVDTAHRLRAVLNRFDTPSRTTPSSSRGAMPPSPSEPESDFDLPPAQAARASIKVLLQNALRDPGDTPQKPKLTRRASFNALGSPKVSKSRRKSTSDEENETSIKRHDDRRSDLSTAASLDRLRLQLTESMPSNPTASSSSSTSRLPSEANVSPKRDHISKSRPSLGVDYPINTTSHHSRVSKIPFSDSPVGRAKSHQDLEPFSVANNGGDSVLFSSQESQGSNHEPHVQTQQSSPSSSHVNGLVSVMRHKHDSAPHEPSHASSTQPDVDHRDRLRALKDETGVDREQDSRRPPAPPTRIRTSSSDKSAGHVSPGAWPTPPPPGTSPSTSRYPSHSLTRLGNGVADGQSDDGRSASRGTSTSSNADNRDRAIEIGREHRQELERNWNRPHLQHSQSTPHLQIEGSYTQNNTHRSESPTEHSRPHSRIGHERARTVSPSYLHSRDEDVEKQFVVENERERNWNAPRPKWGQHPHHSLEKNDSHIARSPSPMLQHVPSHSRPRTNSSASLDIPGDGQSRSRPHSRAQHDQSHPHSYLDGRTDHSRTGSPSSSASSLSHQEEDVDELHERERNWNAPRPKWGLHEHVHHGVSGHETDYQLSRNASSLPMKNSDSIYKEREKGWGRHRPDSSLEVPAEARRTRSPSPVPNARHSGGSHRIGRSKSPVPPAHAFGVRLPRPNSPLLPLTGEEGKDKKVDAGHRIDMNSARLSPSHRHHRTPSSPSPVPSRPESRASNSTSLTSLSARGATSTRHISTAEHALPPDIRKGHRRTTTELSEGMGPFPRKALPPSVALPDEDSDGSLFADESVPPPRMSTPTLRKGHLPDLSPSSNASDIPLPPSPPSSGGPTARADADLARLQRAVTPNFTFPTRQPSPSKPEFSTSPHRSSLDAQKIEFKTPSPPLSLPDLPDPPPFDAEAETSSRLNGRVETPVTSSSVLKTPRFPGAFGTPAPLPSAPNEDDDMSSDELEATPKLRSIDTLVQSPAQDGNVGMVDLASVPVTPAPPGAYHPTPSASKRKGILKVRFDGDVKPAELVNGVGNSVNGISSTTKVPLPPPSPSSEDIPPLNLSPLRRKGLRLVDEYGRARRFTEDGEEIILGSRRKSETVSGSPTRTSPSKQPPADDVTMTPRRRAKMRQVDAFGNGITEERRPVNGEVDEVKSSRKAVVSRLTRSLGELKDELAGEEEALGASLPHIGPRDNERLMDLAVLSKTARIERDKLSRKLQLERHTEPGVTDKVYADRDSPLSDTLSRAPWWRRKWRLALCLLILELVVLCVGYRLASMHAKQAWLATHYDPFFPALYLQKKPPNFISRFGTLPAGWSAFAISGAVQRVGVRGFVEGVGKQLWEGLRSWRMEPWELWGSPTTGPPVPQPWPPS